MPAGQPRYVLFFFADAGSSVANVTISPAIAINDNICLITEFPIENAARDQNWMREPPMIMSIASISTERAFGPPLEPLLLP